MSRRKDTGGPIRQVLLRLLEQAREVRLSEADRLVVFSDLHVGNRSRKDDFRKNGQLFHTILRDHYLPGGFRLLLNGDIEELHRFWLREILSAWPDLYELLGRFAGGSGLIKIVGNHDALLPLHHDYPLRDCLADSVRLRYQGVQMVVFHGHQASYFQSRFNLASAVVLRYIAKPLGISTYSVSHDNTRKFRVESRVYGFAQERRVMAFIGHTHRPLFESLSKMESLQFEIEALCRRYPSAPPAEQQRLEAVIRHCKEELSAAYDKRGRVPSRRSVYNSRLVVPCLFNSGCGIGKRGITALEIVSGRLALVHWYDRTRREKPPESAEREPVRLRDSDYYHVVIKEESLPYLATRVRLLAD